MLKKVILLFILLVVNVSYAMDNSSFGIQLITLINELTVQEREEESEKLKKYKQKQATNITKKKKKDEEPFLPGYSATEIKLIGTGLLVTFVFFLRNCFNR